MKPEQFIREFGVEKAREVVEGHSKAYMPELFKYWSEQLNDYVLAPKYASFLVEDLKRLVESLDLFKELKTKKNANREFMKACMRGQTERANQIKRAMEAQDAVFGRKGASHE